MTLGGSSSVLNDGAVMREREVARDVSALVREFYERIWNEGDREAVDELLGHNFSFRGSLGLEMRGRTAFWEYVTSVRCALGQYHCDVLDCVAQGEKCFAKMRFSGIHVRAFRGYSPTGKLVQWLGAALFRSQGQQLVEVWVLGDLISLEADLKRNL
jgi:predicted ester cyclase